MVNYNVPPRSRASDLTKARITQDEIIALQIANDKNISDARKSVKMGEPAKLLESQEKTPEELLGDIAAQENELRRNIERLGLRPQEAVAAVLMVKNDGDDDLILIQDLNINFPAIEADIKKRFNPKLLTPTFLVEYFRKYSSTLEAAAGFRVFQPHNGGLNGLVNNVDELGAVLPDPNVIRILQEQARQRRVSGEILEDLRRLQFMLPDAAQMNELRRMDLADQQRVIADILYQFRNLPSGEEIRQLTANVRGGIEDRLGFFRALEGLVASIPTQTVNIVERERTGGNQKAFAGDDSSMAAESRSGVADIFEESAGERKARLRREEREETLRQERLKEERDIQADRDWAQTQFDIEQAYIRKYKGVKVQDIPIGAAPPDIYTADPRKRQFYAELVEEAERAAGRTPVKFAPSISDLTDASGASTVSLSSGISILERPISKAELKATFDAHPEFKTGLRYRGQPFDYRDIQLTEVRSANSRKVWIADPDLNLRDMMTAKFGRGQAKKGSTIQQQQGKPKMYLGNGIKPMSRQRVTVGKGIAVQETPSYKQFGKYAIHIPQLEQQDILNVKYKSLGQVPKYKPMAVSDIFRDFLLDLLDNGKPNVRTYQQIAPDERKVFEEMSIGAGVWNALGLKRTTTSTDDEENKRFELLKGEYMAGNNNPKVISELRRLVVKMIGDGRIKKSQGMELLMELSI
jgi:hypothetical protein